MPRRPREVGWRGLLEAPARAPDRALPCTVVGRLLTREELLRWLRTRLLLSRALA